MIYKFIFYSKKCSNKEIAKKILKQLLMSSAKPLMIEKMVKNINDVIKIKLVFFKSEL